MKNAHPEPETQILASAFELIPERFAHKVGKLTGIEIGAMPVWTGFIGDMWLFRISFLQHGCATFGAMIIFYGIGLFTDRFIPTVDNVIGHPDVVAQST